MSHETNAPQEEMQELTAALLKEVMPLKTRVRVAFAREAGGRIINSAIVGFKGNHFYVAGLPDVAFVMHGLALISFSTPKAMYSFVSRLEEMVETERTAAGVMLGFQIPQAWKRVQRRENFRLELRVPVRVCPDGNESRAVEGQSVNLSASGLLVALPRAFNEGQAFKLFFSVPKEGGGVQEFALGAVVARRMQAERRGEDAPVYLHGFHFDEMSARDQDRLAQCLWRLSKGRPIA